MTVSVEFRREMIDVASIGQSVGNTSWSYTDSHGHVHTFEGDDLPTLEWVITGTYWCDDCRDEHEEGEWRCRVCGDVVEPRWSFTGPITMQIPGLGEWWLTIDEKDQFLPVSGDEARELSSLSGDALIARALEIAAKREP